MRSPVSSICMARFGPIGAGERHHRRGAEQPDADAGRGEAGARLGDREVAGGDQLAAGRGGHAVHPGDHRLGDRLHRRHEGRAAGEDSAASSPSQAASSVEVVAGREGGPGAGDARPPARRRPPGRVCSSRMSSSGQRVAAVGAVERDARGHATVLHPEVLPVRHRSDRTGRRSADASFRAWRGSRRGGRRTSRRGRPPTPARPRPAPSSSSDVTRPSSTADVPRAVDRTRSAQSPPHHPRSSSVRSTRPRRDGLHGREAGLQGPGLQPAARRRARRRWPRRPRSRRRATGRGRASGDARRTAR